MNTIKIEIEQTEDYSKFDVIMGNRNISKVKIDKICNDIKDGFNMLPYCPIIVSEGENKLKIIDGQHRFEVSKKTSNPVYYVICNTLTLRQIALLNSRGDKWKVSDFLQCYIKLGIQDYSTLTRVMDKYKISVRVAADLLMFNQAKANSGDVLQSGEFKCNYLEEVNVLLDLVQSIFHTYKFSMDRYLIAAVQTLQKKGLCDFEKLKTKIAAAPMIMSKQTDPKSYLNNIEAVYNYKNSKREIIF